MDKDTRNAIERATQRARKLLEEDFSSQLEGTFDVLRSGTIAEKGGAHLSARQGFQRDRIVAAIEHKRAAGMTAAGAVTDYVRDAAFTTLNRFVALKVLEARELVQECITRGDHSSGYREFCGMAPGVALLPESAGYRLYIESLFDELSTEVKVLFDRRDSASVLWPKRLTFDALLETINVTELAGVWGEDETVGWVYQFFNSNEERAAMRDPKQGGSQAPRNSRELAVRNQFFTPRYVVQFLTDNTLGRIWYEMRGGRTTLRERCEYLVRRHGEPYIPRTKKDPRDIRVLDPACGSGHFLLYAFDLLLTIYEEAYRDADSPKSEATGKTIAADYPSIDAMRRVLPPLILAHNLHGVDIDPRCAQIAQLALWTRAQRAFRDFGIGRAERPLIRRSNIVVAEPLVADDGTLKEFLATLGDAELVRGFTDLVETLKLAGDLGLLLRVEGLIARGPKPGQTGELFTPAEARIRAALASFVASERAQASTRRRLFVDDAAQGVGLLETAEKRFDVVLMNPPFGLPTPRAKPELKRQYPDSWTDLFNACLVRAQHLSAPDGTCIGAIVPDRLLVSKKSSGVRKLLLSTMQLSTLVEIGSDVMDGAAVNAVMLTTDSRMRTLSVYTKGQDVVRSERAQSLGRWTRAPGEPTDFSNLSVVPGAPLVLGAGAGATDLWQRSARLQPDLAVVATGAKTFDDFRFLRAWWEVEPSSIGKTWVPVDVGGDYKPALAIPKMTQNWGDEGREIRAKAVGERETEAQVLQSSKFWFKKCLSYPYTSSIGFAPRLFFADSILSTDAVAIVPHEPADLLWLLGVLLSTDTVNALSSFGSGRKTENSSVKSLPIAPPAEAAALGRHVSRLLAIALEEEAIEETSRAFSKPLTTFPDALRTELEGVAQAIDSLSASAYGRQSRPAVTLCSFSAFLAGFPIRNPRARSAFPT